jgi:hypothetical protein
MAFEEDKSEFFKEFGIVAKWNGVEVTGILERRYIESSMIQGEAPVFTCDQDDVTDIAQGDAVVVNKTSYVVREYKADGDGFIDLILEDQT